MPEGITYTVTEAESVGYALDDTNSSGMTGTIVRDNAGTATVSVINRYILKTGGFKIKKQVVGRETDEKFTITVILNGLVDGMSSMPVFDQPGGYHRDAQFAVWAMHAFCGGYICTLKKPE